LIEKTVDDLLIQTASWRDHRLAIINKLVEILESDPGWIERYEISGEVFLPSKDSELGDINDISEAVERSKQVSKLKINVS
jgi:trafficking protein particle complex subunit 10